MKLGELAEQLGAECRGTPDTEITGVAGIEEAGPGQVTFVANSKYALLAKKTKAGAVLVAPDFPEIHASTLRIKNPYLAFARAIEIFHPPPLYAPGIHATAVISPTAKIGREASIGAYVVIGENCVIGDHATILPHAVIYPNARIGDHFFAHAHSVVREDCRLGNNVVLQNGVVVGSDGYGFAKDDAGKWHKIVQSGPAIVEDDVEIQANSCIDRASVGETRIGRGAKIDNLVQVGHGSSIGENTLLCAQVGLAGSTHIGDDAILAGQVGVAGHCHIGDRVIVTAQSGVGGNIEAGKIISGSPAYDNRQWLRVSAIMPRLPEMLRQFQRKRKPENE
ncbi:UDP-3-O-(3-hydroxymyristoyl)glucosamine N-acyltransferase [Alloacidobacterium sp.]|uniref:UDP-3-O-(3-hydroxymyristoyl)glucosamine N-acyltransferase n=1 Tax=Alloacidobacterium sp. TaxID=2951999 RepID=UPI002D305498|nr:UDP-3-O-(3-hydroxymyristoyl)glucosamine N-acyltransferase [Alloacidobacterium sp.]HYK36365.1 UDP-3-O-(3-hydroxymyristoyl)glucosamine N-acyltransferase [Alloacidobacterium sp.]